MEVNTFLRAIKRKDRQKLREANISYGQWENKSLVTTYKYTPLDECPRCNAYDLEYYTLKAKSFQTYLKSFDYVRGRHCKNCKYTEEVDDDPSNQLTGSGGLTGVIESLTDSDREF
jgi:hypothetical protein